MSDKRAPIERLIDEALGIPEPMELPKAVEEAYPASSAMLGVLNAAIDWWKSHKHPDMTLDEFAENPLYGFKLSADIELAKALQLWFKFDWPK